MADWRRLVTLDCQMRGEETWPGDRSSCQLVTGGLLLGFRSTSSNFGPKKWATSARGVCHGTQQPRRRIVFVRSSDRRARMHAYADVDRGMARSRSTGDGRSGRSGTLRSLACRSSWSIGVSFKISIEDVVHAGHWSLRSL